MSKLKTMFKENWKPITFSYTLFFLDSALFTIYPKVLGNTIDHLVLKDYNYVWYLIITFTFTMFFSFVSRIYDTKVFTSIYRRFASIETSKQIDSGVESTKINGRLTLMNSIVRFFERDMLVMIQTIVTLVGCIYFLLMVSSVIVSCLVITAVLILGTAVYFSPKIAHITSLNNDISEEQSDVVFTKNISAINNILRRGQKLSLRLSLIDARFYLCIQVIVYGTVTSLLTYYVMFNKVSIGGVFSTYRYMFDFCNALIGIPIIVTSYINIKDVIKRLETEN